MFRRSISISTLLLAAFIGLPACQDVADIVDRPDAPKAEGSLTATDKCTDSSFGSTWTITPAESTVAAGEVVHFVVMRDGKKYTTGLKAPIVRYAAPTGGTLADPSAVETDYAAGAVPGDYEVDVKIVTAEGAMTVCSLKAIVHVKPPPTFDPPVTVPEKLDLSGAWELSDDANLGAAAPVTQLVASSSESVTVSYDGVDGRSCGCKSFHKVIKLSKSYDCSSTTLAFDYMGGGSFGYTSTQSVSIRFCKDGSCPTQSFYQGDEFIGSQQTGHSNCAYRFANSFPASPELKGGKNRIPLSTLDKGTNGSCSGSFDTIDVHMQTYACFTERDQGTATLSNLVLY